MQAALFHSIKPLFANKPLLVVCNKTDVTPLESLSPEDRAALQDMALEAAKSSMPGAFLARIQSFNWHYDLTTTTCQQRNTGGCSGLLYKVQGPAGSGAPKDTIL